MIQYGAEGKNVSVWINREEIDFDACGPSTDFQRSNFDDVKFIEELRNALNRWLEEGGQ